MSNAIFPTFIGLEWNILRQPIWSTTTRRSVSGRRFAAANYSYPRYKYRMSYSVLRQGAALTELAQLVGFFNARQGSFDSFLITDPDDNTVTNAGIAIGDGVTRVFQLTRPFGGFNEPVYDTNGEPRIFVNAVEQTGAQYSISATRLITFVAPPSLGAVITWTGAFYRRVYFAQDTADFNKFMSNLWELKKLELETYRP